MTDDLDGCGAVLDDLAAYDPDGTVAMRRAASTSSSTVMARSGHDTGIADRLRKAGLKVVEVAGWRTRGSSTFNPRGSVDHHTASGPNGNAPSLNICIYGRSDLPGPLCHVLIARDNTCYVIAAGRANHAGKGGWKGLSGNSSVFGIERENVGTTAEPWRPDQTETAARAHAALIAPYDIDAGMVCAHREWAPNRKPDAHSVSYPAFRLAVAKALTAPKPDPPLPDKVPPMFDPPHVLQPIVDDCPAPEGGVILLGRDGSIYNYGGAAWFKGANGEPWFAGRKAARLDHVGGPHPWQITADTGERYHLPL